jgi:DNA polymerase-4
MEIRLKDRGVRTMADLIDRTPEELINVFGSIHGEWWWHWLRGHDPEQREHGTHSIGHQHVLPPKHRNLADARAIIIRLLHKAAARMRAKSLLSPTLCVFVRTMNEGPGGGRGWGGKSSWERTLKLGLPTDDTLAFIDAFAAAWKSAESDLAASRLLMVGITLVDLVPAAATTLPLFGQSRPRQKLGAIMDKINTTYGKGTLYPASMHIAKDTAPVRIAFHSIPDLDLPA